jgi:hypothetical protein
MLPYLLVDLGEMKSRVADKDREIMKEVLKGAD